MLAYLIDEPHTPGEHEDVSLVVPAPDDQEAWAQVAYEAAQHLESAWIPGRRRGPGANPCTVRT